MKVAKQNCQPWDIVPLGDVCNLISGQHIEAKKYNTRGKGIGYLTGPADFGEHHPTVSKWTEYPQVLASRGDILITVKGSGVGKINILNEAEVAISRQLMAIRPTNATPDFIFHYLSGKFKYFQELSKGAAIPGLSRGNVTGLPIPLPPLPEQRRIVAILDEAFAGIDAAMANTRRNLANARALFENHLNAVFSQIGDGWVENRLGEIGGEVATGPFGSLLHKSDYVEDGIPLVNPANIVNGRIEPDASKTVNVDTPKRLSSYRLIAGDIVVGRRGEIGRCAVVLDHQSGWLCGTGSFAIKPFSGVNPVFLAHLIRSETYRTQLEKMATGTTMKNLSNKSLSNLIIALPTLAVQEQILLKLDALVEESQRLEALYTRKLEALAELKQSILQKAFSGQLTAQEAAA